ncbi:MOS1T transposase, partial [Pseudoatta argentina]
MIQKQGNWVPYELKPRDVERHLFTYEQLLEKQRRKGFLHRIVTGDEKWVHYDNPKRRKSWGVPGHASISTAKPNIHGSKGIFLDKFYMYRGRDTDKRNVPPTITASSDWLPLFCQDVNRALGNQTDETEHAEIQKSNKVKLILSSMFP